MKAAARAGQVQFGHHPPKRQPVLSAENLEPLGRGQCGRFIAPQVFEMRSHTERLGRRRGVAEFGRASARRVDQFARAHHLAQVPVRHCEAGRRYNAGVVAEAFPRLPIAHGVVGVERPLAVGPRLDEVARKEAHKGEGAARDAGFHHAPRALGLRRYVEASSRADLSSPRTAPRTIGGGKSRSARKSRRSPPRARARVRRPPLSPRRRTLWTTSPPGRRPSEGANGALEAEAALTSSVSASAASNPCALAISGISGVGQASERGREDGVGFGGVAD